MPRQSYRLINKVLVIASGIAAFAAATPAHAQLGLGMTPMRVELSVAPGQQYSGTLKLSSQSGEAVRIRGEALDFHIDKNTTPQFERELPGESAVSCKKWLTLNPTELEIEKEA